jgi:N-carbamoyl-L-amino-acid hydrolase
VPVATAAIAAAGILTAMVFVRNANGSHNPHEAMAASDLDEAVRLLTALCLRMPELSS